MRPSASLVRVRSMKNVLQNVGVTIGVLTFLVVPGTASASSPNAFAGVAGVYRFSDGSAAALVEQNGGLRLVDYRTGALRQLTQRTQSAFVGGPGVSVSTPVSVRVTLGRRRDGFVTSARFDGRAAKRVALVTQPASFGDNGVRLAGRLILPPGKGPFPAVVIVPGSVPAHRDTYDLWALFFASRGFAVLTYDKRGVGDSTGRYVRAATDANLRDLAADALAAVAWLRHRADVDSARIGLSGGSQAGWVIALAASQSHNVRFAALQSGPAMSVGRQLAYGALTKDGAVAPTDEQIHAALDGVPDSGFDPRAALASLTIPVLWQFGTVDRRMYTPESLADLAAVTASGTHDFTVHVYPGGAHSLRSTADGVSAEERTSPGFVPGVFADLAAWLASHV
jgi:dienelactone hydrolase